VIILSGMAWLDAESNARFSHGFAQASDVERRAIFDSIAFRAKVQPGYERPAFSSRACAGWCWAVSILSPRA